MRYATAVKAPGFGDRRKAMLEAGNANNAGFEGAVVVQHVMEGEGNFGFNAGTGTYEDLMNAGIVDPTKVTRFSLQNAASVAVLLMTTEAMVAEKPKKGGIYFSLRQRTPLNIRFYR